MNDNLNDKIGKIQNKYIKLGLTVFVVGVLLIITYYMVHNVGSVKNGIGKMNDILMPFYLGIVIAYLLSPVYNGVVKLLYAWGKNKFKKPYKCYKFSRFMGTVVSVLLFICIIVGFCWLIFPNLLESVIGLVSGIPSASAKVLKWVQGHLEENPEIMTFFKDKVENLSANAMTWAQQKLLPGAESFLTEVSIGVIGTLNTIMDVCIALIICVYILNSKEMFQAQGKKLVMALFKKDRADKIFEFGSLANQTFGGFINGKIIDSIIIGIICFIVMSLMRLPLAMLISVVIGITNIIPFFGPFIGAIPSIIILLLIDPLAALKFIIMILVLQQVDGNIIGPKILGKTTKLQSFWVMFAILVGGGLFGFPGMILGVPVFALFYTYMSRIVNNRLKNKTMPTETTIYEDLDKYGINKEDVFGKKSLGKAEYPEEKQENI